MPASSTLSLDSPRTDPARAHAWNQPFPIGRARLLALFVAACVVGLGYSLYTAQVWEDTLITLRHAENLLRGNKLTYNPGELVHGFTSPVNVILLTFCHLLTGQTSYIWTCWLYRLFTIAAFAGGAVLAIRALSKVEPRWIPALGFVAFAYLFDVKSVAFSTNGMETGFMLLLVAWAICLLSQGRPDQWLTRGLCWAALMWTRPDGCVYILALAVAELLFFGTGGRRSLFTSLVKSTGLCAIIYSPWILWAWWYYGSPIPHTIIAKANVEAGTVQQALNTLDNLISKVLTQAGLVFRPLYDRDEAPWLPSLGWTRVLNGLTKAAGLFCLLYWLVPSRDRLGRAMSLCFTLLCIHFSYMRYCFPWYYPPVTLFGLVAIARGFTMFVDSAPGGVASERIGPRKGLALAAMGILLVGQIALFALTTREERIQQQVIEEDQRTVIGAWLKEHAQPTDSVFLEPLGYIGYFSGLRMMDRPGLVSPQVVAARRETKSDILGPIVQLSPDWVVLRFWEYDLVKNSPYSQAFHESYRLARTFDVNKELDAYGFLTGEFILRYDAAFHLFARNATRAGSSSLPPTLPPGQ